MSTLQDGKNENSSVSSAFPLSKPVKRRRPPAVRHPLPLKKPKQLESPSAVNAMEQHEEKISELQLKVLRLEKEVRTLESRRFLLRRFQGSDRHSVLYWSSLLLHINPLSAASVYIRSKITSAYRGERIYTLAVISATGQTLPMLWRA